VEDRVDEVLRKHREQNEAAQRAADAEVAAVAQRGAEAADLLERVIAPALDGMQQRLEQGGIEAATVLRSPASVQLTTSVNGGRKALEFTYHGSTPTFLVTGEGVAAHRVLAFGDVVSDRVTTLAEDFVVATYS
jgi:hypothetical protein